MTLLTRVERPEALGGRAEIDEMGTLPSFDIWKAQKGYRNLDQSSWLAFCGAGGR